MSIEKIKLLFKLIINIDKGILENNGGKIVIL